MHNLIDKLYINQELTEDEYKELILNIDNESKEYLFKKSNEVREKYYGKKVYIRGLIEFTNYCKNDCYYCGIRAGNNKVNRYRLTKEDILSCVDIGHTLGYKTVVLQGGEDPYYTDDIIVDIVTSIKDKYPKNAITLSMGEKPYESYIKYFNAGADRYLLRHESANNEHYRKLHPHNLNPLNRKKCLDDLKSIGYQVGIGFMVGSPYQSINEIIEDLKYIKSFTPHMIGIGPFIPASNTPFENAPPGDAELTCLLIAIIRLITPKALIPSTTALGTIDSDGREKGLKAGANVVMPNLSPIGVRKSYSIYNNKLFTGEEASEYNKNLELKINKAGFIMVSERGDYIN